MTSHAPRHAIACGDVLEVLRGIPDNTFHGMLSDPPYGLEFMGKSWDKVVPPAEVWREALRVLRPGGYALVFGGTRTFHRLAVALEDAGFEIRDCLCWLYGSGFPKSLDVSKALDKAAGATRKVVGRGRRHNSYSKGSGASLTHGVGVPMLTAPATADARAWDGYGTALKPAWEPVLLLRKPLDGTVARNVRRWGCGALAIDPCRIGTVDRLVRPHLNHGHTAYSGGPLGAGRQDEPAGRFPANVLLDDDAARVLDAAVGTLHGRGNVTPYRRERRGASVALGRFDNVVDHAQAAYREAGGPSRFFYAAKVSSSERNAGLEAFPVLSGGEATDREDDSEGLNSPRAGAGRTGGNRNPHPTLKPLALAAYLARLLLPPGPDATLLVPYSGVGSELAGALQAGWPRALGIERDPEYVRIAEARLAHHVYKKVPK